MTATQTPDTKHGRIFQALKEDILGTKLACGEPLPSQADLMEKYGVSLGTVRQALNRLQVEGLVSSRRGVGSFVSRQAKENNAISVVGLIVFAKEGVGLTMEDSLMALQTALAEEQLNLMVKQFEPTQIEDAVQWASQLSGILTWESIPDEFIQRLTEKGIPVVVLGNFNKVDPGICQIGFDLGGVFDQAVQFMANMGYRHITFINRSQGEAETNLRLYESLPSYFDESIQQYLPEGEGEKLALNPSDPNDIDTLITKLECLPSRGSTALIFEGTQRACRFIYAMQRRGWSVPEDISVLSFSTVKPDRVPIEGTSYVEMRMDELVTRSAKALTALIRGERAAREFVPPRLHWGTTCRPVRG